MLSRLLSVGRRGARGCVHVARRGFFELHEPRPVEKQIFSNAVRIANNEEELRVLFDIIDSDNSGAIDRIELETLISSCGHISTEEMTRFFGERDAIGFEEFCEFIRDNKELLLTQKLLSPYRVVFMVGGPGSGKGTYSNMLAKKLDFVRHLSSGELLRHEVVSGSDLGKQIAHKIAHGELISASIVMALLDKSLGDSAGKIVLLDGFPRSLDNARDFLSIYSFCEAILYFDCPEEEMVRRIVERGRTSGRSDDNEITALNRIAVFHSQSREPVDYLVQQGVPRFVIDATQPIEDNLQKLLKLPIFTPLMGAKRD